MKTSKTVINSLEYVVYKLTHNLKSQGKNTPDTAFYKVFLLPVIRKEEFDEPWCP